MTKFSNSQNIFKVNVKVFIEGIEVPYSSVSVSYGIDSEPSCTISMPGSAILRELPDNTSIIVLYKDPQANNSDDWYVLFDGEIEGWNYGIDANGASITISAIHGTKWLNLMQLIIQEASAKAAGMDNIAWGGGTADGSQVNGISYTDTALLEGLFPGTGNNEQKLADAQGKFKSMADIVYSIIRTHLSSKLYGAATTAFFRKKIENVYSLPTRIFGTSSDIESKQNAIISTIQGKQPTSSGSGDIEDQKVEFNVGKYKVTADSSD